MLVLCRNESCFYLEIDDNDETILPCGGEFQQAVDLFNTPGGSKTLIRFLSFLKEILADVGATDDEKEEAREFIVWTFKMLSAIMHKDRYVPDLVPLGTFFPTRGQAKRVVHTVV